MTIENVADLQVLVHTARGGTLTAAAQSLGITPAAASAMLKRLETQLGCRLFERSTRAMRLTPRGQTLLDYALRAFELLAEGEAQVTADLGALVGPLRITSPSDLARTTLISWLDEFLASHPGLELTLSVRDLPLDVMREEVDVAIRYGNMADSGLVARLLTTTHPVLCASPDYLKQHGTPLHPEDLPRHNCITFDRGGRRHRDWRFARGGEWTEVRVSGNRHADDASLAREWAIAGAGLLFKTQLDVRHDLERGALVRLLPDWRTEPYPLHAVMPSGRFVLARVRALVDFLALKFRALMAVEVEPPGETQPASLQGGLSVRRSR